MDVKRSKHMKGNVLLALARRKKSRRWAQIMADWETTGGTLPLVYWRQSASIRSFKAAVSVWVCQRARQIAGQALRLPPTWASEALALQS
jgi:hypothetical protein